MPKRALNYHGLIVFVLRGLMSHIKSQGCSSQQVPRLQINFQKSYVQQKLDKDELIKYEKILHIKSQYDWVRTSL